MRSTERKSQLHVFYICNHTAGFLSVVTKLFSDKEVNHIGIMNGTLHWLTRLAVQIFEVDYQLYILH